MQINKLTANPFNFQFQQFWQDGRKTDAYRYQNKVILKEPKFTRKRQNSLLIYTKPRNNDVWGGKFKPWFKLCIRVIKSTNQSNFERQCQNNVESCSTITKVIGIKIKSFENIQPFDSLEINLVSILPTTQTFCEWKFFTKPAI